MIVRVQGDNVHIEGYVNAVERLSKRLTDRFGEFMERIKAGAFGRAIKRNPNIRILLNHDWDRDLGGTDSNLKLEEDNIGLRAVVDITDPKVAEDARKGNLVGWSFGFTDRDNGVYRTEEEGLPVRNVKDLDLYEVSLLNREAIPAYDGTLVTVRAIDGEQMHISHLTEDKPQVEEIRAEVKEEEKIEEPVEEEPTEEKPTEEEPAGEEDNQQTTKRSASDDYNKIKVLYDNTKGEESMKKYKYQHEKLNELMTRADELKSAMETRELTDDEAQELAEIRDDVKKIKDALGIMDEIGDAEGREETDGEEERAEERAEEDVEKFNRYVRSMALKQRGDDVNLTKGDNGDIIPTTIANKIIEKIYAICPIVERADVYNVKGNLSIPYYDESTTAITVGYANEFEELTSGVGSFDTVDLTGFLAGALVKISKSLINNEDFNLTDYIVNRMAYSFKRWIEGECLKGTASKIAGLTGATLTVTAGAQTAITADEVIQLHDKIIDDYQSNAIFIMSSATRTALRTLKGSDGHYLLNDDITSEFGSTLLGKPVFVTDNMDDMGAGKTAIYYGDLSGLAIKFSEQIDVQVLVERFATQHAVGVVGWTEVDAKVEDAQKVAKLVMASA